MTFLHQFLEMMAKERRVTRSTLSAYDADLRNFYEFLKDKKVERLTFADIQDYLATQSHLSSATLARRLSSLRQFYAYLVTKGATKENPLPFIKVAPLQSKSPSSLSPTHVEGLLEGVKAWNEPEGKRLSALLQILQATDMPVKDIVSLPYHSLDGAAFFDSSFDFGAPRLRSGRTEEGSFLHTVRPERRLPELVEGSRSRRIEWCALQEYLKVRPYFLAPGQDSPWLFPSSSQTGHLTPQRFGQLLKELGLKIGIDPALISLSTFRCGLRYFKKL